MSTARGSRKGMGRRPLTREMLLPFTPAQVRALSLPAHLALVALKNGEGDEVHVRLFAGVICRTALMGRLSSTEVDEPALEEADRVIRRMLDTVEPDAHWSTDAAESDVFARVLTIYDRQLERLPRHRYFEAQDWLQREADQLPPSELARLPAWCREETS